MTDVGASETIQLSHFLENPGIHPKTDSNHNDCDDGFAVVATDTVACSCWFGKKSCDESTWLRSSSFTIRF